ncbi:uncharacterized protein PG998_013063 [Apiospora kogelbergensis]|uniref:uncharacterized protein n=1 Tax=Apiospora kogelbergensis TaxID=1337665 RepID=UPI00312F774A
MLVKSEDFNAPSSEALDEDDEDSINKRDLVAILSPVGRDMAEIVLSDGTVWTAKPRIQGTAVSYDFTTEDEQGKLRVARWACRKDTGKPAAVTHDRSFVPTTPNHGNVEAQLSRGPGHIHHRLSVSGAVPPTSSILGSPTSTGPADDRPPPERTVQPVEDWQKTLIQVTALWVVLHHGWVGQFRPMNIESLAAAGANSPDKGFQTTRSFSFGSGSLGQTRGNPLHRITRRANTSSSTQCCERESSTSLLGALPRRATSTGAAYVQKRNALNRLSVESPSSEDSEQRRGQDPLDEGDWTGSGSLTRSKRPALNHDFSTYPSPSGVVSLAPEPLPSHRRVVSEYYCSTPWRVSSPLSLEEEEDERKDPL